MDKQYFKYLLHRYDVAYMKLLGSGVRQTISFNHIANSILIAPPLAEQRAITVFLDDKCANIDGAVKIKEDQIALLRERRQIIIQDAVTRGLNPAVPMKDSGIDWIGRIPAHWVVRRSKFVFTQRKEFARKDDVQLSGKPAPVGDGPYRIGLPGDFNAQFALDTAMFWQFLQTTPLSPYCTLAAR